MAFLTSAVQMTEPSGLWQWFILNVFGFMGDYGWRIVLLVVFLKLILSPLDFYQRYKMRKNQSITEALKPQLDKLEKQYGEDKRTLQQKQMELNRKAGFSYMSACIPLIITLVLFITFFTGFRSVSAYMEFKQYVEMHDAYVAAYNETGFAYDTRVNGNGAYKLVYDENKDYSEVTEWLNNIFANKDREEAEETLKSSIDSAIDTQFSDFAMSDYATTLMRYKEEFTDKGKTYKDFVREYKGETDQRLEGETNEEFKARERFVFSMSILMQAKAQEETVPAFKENRTPFLWIKSLWVADVPWAKSLPEWSAFQATMSSYGYLADNINNNPSNVYKLDDKSENYKYDSLIKETTYEIVTSKVRKMDDLYNTNGYLILVVLVLGLSILSQVISNMQQKKSGQAMQGNGSGMMKAMLWIMPIMLGVFALTSSSAFTLYMVVNSIMSLIINFITSLIVNAIFGKNSRDTVIVKHGRADPNEKNNKK